MREGLPSLCVLSEVHGAAEAEQDEEKEPRLLMSPLTSETMPDSVVQDKNEPLWFQ